MASSEFLEDLVLHLRALELLQQVDYHYRTPTETSNLPGRSRNQVVLKPIVIEQLRKHIQNTLLARRKTSLRAPCYTLRVAHRQ